MRQNPTTDAICTENDCRPFPVQTVSVPRTNGICTGGQIGTYES
ncbi:hypothetical protein HMPREF0658_1332 [Hoylesella marshii DSM 16973 = JCM 13450]|uniref:Uncharacterized protein n=1 Tax=Hoylesella marshii DSM 16973 = JCM 13450 TaxID=862515 RepID=E0NSY0_9BACT|nr:hypothetical protein HMPREF0658_1332 [Hoylesella marshii DSM 16973 = JCM 13450]